FSDWSASAPVLHSLLRSEVDDTWEFPSRPSRNRSSRFLASSTSTPKTTAATSAITPTRPPPISNPPDPPPLPTSSTCEVSSSALSSKSMVNPGRREAFELSDLRLPSWAIRAAGGYGGLGRRSEAAGDRVRRTRPGGGGIGRLRYGGAGEAMPRRFRREGAGPEDEAGGRRERTHRVRRSRGAEAAPFPG